MVGWIKISRDMPNHWIWKDDTKLKWWLDMLITVNFKDNKILMGNQLIECKRGQSVMSLQQWATRWKVDKNKVRNFFVLLEKDGMIIHENLSKTTRITICKYDTYQSKENDNKTQSKRNQNVDETQSYPIEESKEGFKEGEKEIENNVFNFANSIIELGVDKQIVKDWMIVRNKKKAANTLTAFDGIVREINKTNLTPNEIIKLCAEKSWISFKAEWVKSEKPQIKHNYNSLHGITGN